MKFVVCSAMVALSLNLIGCGESDKAVSYETNVASEESSSSLQELSSSSEQLSSSVETPSSSSKAEDEIVYGIFVDPGNNHEFKTVVIGKGDSAQTWMAENMNYEVVNGFCYQNQPFYCQKYGRLYTWDAAQKICPKGSHLPSKEEFEQLFRNMGNSFTEGTRLRSKEGWSHKNGTDNFGFTALPGGYKTETTDFRLEGDVAFFWTSSKTEDGDAIDFSLTGTFDAEATSTMDARYALSVRCIIDK